MKNDRQTALISFAIPILTWSAFILLFFYFKWDVRDSITSFYQERSKVGADFNTDSAIIIYLSILTERILFFMMLGFAGLSTAFFYVVYRLGLKIKVLESELNELKK